MSDNFTKMVNNKWIQDGWEPKVGDWVIHNVVKRLVITTIGGSDIISIQRRGYEEIRVHKNWSSNIWLPTIEQLMEMVEYKNKYSLLRDIKNFLTYKGTEKWSWQELLLAFVMHKLHRLKRDGERWAK